jgi:hypothetical protein
LEKKNFAHDLTFVVDSVVEPKYVAIGYEQDWVVHIEPNTEYMIRVNKTLFDVVTQDRDIDGNIINETAEMVSNTWGPKE